MEGQRETTWPSYIEHALWAIATVALNPEVPEADQYIRAFAHRWGSLELDGLLRAEEGTLGLEGDDRLFVVFALGYTGTPEAQHRLGQLLASPWVGDRWASAICLSQLGEHRALPVLSVMLTELLPERLADYLEPPLSFYESFRWGLPMKIETFRDPVAVPALRHALERLIYMLDQAILPESDAAALALARLDRKAMSREDIACVEAVFEPRPHILLERLRMRGEVRDDGPSPQGRSEPGATMQVREDVQRAHLNNLILFEDDIVYTLGRLGGMGVLTGLRAAQPFLQVWAVHLLMAQVHDHYTRSDVAPVLSPTLEADLRQRLQSMFGLTAEEQEQALALYMLTKKVGILMRYSRERALPQQSADEIAGRSMRE